MNPLLTKDERHIRRFWQVLNSKEQKRDAYVFELKNIRCGDSEYGHFRGKDNSAGLADRINNTTDDYLKELKAKVDALDNEMEYLAVEYMQFLEKHGLELENRTYDEDLYELINNRNTN